MKKTTSLLLAIFLTLTTLNAQKKYDELWQKVEKLEVDNLPKSALAIVENIYLQAEKENNAPQLIKSLIYKSKFALTLTEDAQLNVITDFKTHISNTKFPTKNVLENILANLYWQYYQQNRWKFYNRTTTENKVDTTDFRTWDLNTLFEEIHVHFTNSLKNTDKLQAIDVYDFGQILQIEKNSKKHRPTLYDFLAQNALTFYKTSETNLTKPTYQFKITDHHLLSDYKTFISAKINSKDSLSMQLNALRIYKNLLQFHSKKNNDLALADADLARLQFVKTNALFDDVEEIYLKTLQKSAQFLNQKPESGLYHFEVAQVYHQQANSYNAGINEEYRFKNKEALAICEKVIADFPKREAAKKCNQLKLKITEKNLLITAEKFVPIAKPSRVLIDYKNVNVLYFSIYEITFSQQKYFFQLHNQEEKIGFINQLKKVKNWSTNLRNEFDYLPHQTEVVVPQLPQGNYLILATEEEKLSQENIYGFTDFQVTDLVLVNVENHAQKMYQVVDRNTGKAIKNAQIHLKNEPNRYNKERINKILTTDNNGFASFATTQSFANVEIKVTTKTDNVILGNTYIYKSYSNTTNNNEEFTIIKPYIFTDRSIYRPGQTVYFKTICIQKKGETSQPFTNEFINIILEDVNGQEVGNIDLKLNEFGSAAGEFILPNNGITGKFSFEFDESEKKTSKFYDHADFEIDYANYSISVEEYKRPKFKTEFKPVTQTFKVNDSIKITGFAKAFAGSNITDASVVYRVHRKVQYPSWWYWRRPNNSASAQEITNGEITTNSKGEFKITFKAIPDETVNKESLPVFKYEITADVTDVNGETRSATTIVKVGYHSLLATIVMVDKIDQQEKETPITITTKNLNGEFVAAKGNLKIYKLQAPQQVLRNRVWAAPDYQDISETTFRKLFPHEPYTNDETDEKNWKNGKLVFSADFDTEKSKEIALKNYKNWISGKYIVVLESEDKFGQAVKDEKRFSLFNSHENKVADNQLFFINTTKSSYKIGESVELQIGTASKNMSAVVQIEKNYKIVKTIVVYLDDCIETIKIPVNADDVGGFAIKYHYVNYNYFSGGSIPVYVPKEISNIAIETNIFRDKLQPGAEETWSFSIKNDKNNAVVAEVLASMYDASLDEFKAHNWNFNPITTKTYNSYGRSVANQSFGTQQFSIFNQQRNYNWFPQQQYDSYNWFGFSLSNNRYKQKKYLSRLNKNENNIIEIVSDEKEVEETVIEDVPFTSMTPANTALDEAVVAGYSSKNVTTEKKDQFSFDGIQIRKNLQETAFFYPHLKTDKEGNISFSFTSPEALTRWKLQLVAHTKDLKSASKTLQTITQKELMILPNAPRFLRKGDEIVLSAKISNLTANQLNGFAQLQLTDAVTGKEINTALENFERNKNFSVASDGNTSVSWTLKIPNSAETVQYKIVAKAGDFSDGEQNVLPVLSNRMLVTETLPMFVKSNETKTFTLEKLKTNTSSTLKNHKLTLEVTSNPAWYAIQALPYLMEYPYECSEQTFARYYANTLASFVANSNPRIQEVFNAWKNSDALLSTLEKNQELKALIIQETPWLRDAQSETEQKKRIALLFDLNKMKNEQQKAINKLKEMQFSSGGFPWFKGNNYANSYITLHIATGFGHLQKIGVTPFDKATTEMLEKAIQFLDEAVLKQYFKLLSEAKKQKDAKKYLAKNHVSYFTIQYLYMRTFYADVKINAELKSAIDFYQNQTKTFWNDYNLYAKGQIALALFRNNEKLSAEKIVKSLNENSIISDELGMYWKENEAGYYFYQSPIETQALLIETFSEIKKDTEIIDNLKIWLLKNKQTNQWKTTKATTEAIYALMLNGTDFISVTQMLDVKVGTEKINTNTLDNVKVEAGTGYYKTSWNSTEIKPEMSEVTLTKKGNGIAWAGLYWQYFEDLDKITSAETPLILTKKLFLKVNSDTGKQLKEVNEKSTLNVGDLLTVRIVLKSDRELEFIHMKDMRASGVEPINVISKHKYQDGLGYYESTKDAATNFFFEKLPKGVYVFEYDVRVNNAGNFSNGVTTIQSMYAPEFSSHSESIRIQIK